MYYNEYVYFTHFVKHKATEVQIIFAIKPNI